MLLSFFPVILQTIDQMTNTGRMNKNEVNSSISRPTRASSAALLFFTTENRLADSLKELSTSISKDASTTQRVDVERQAAG